MKSSQFEAKTFGVGELISQRKLFRVPAHQRSYAWDKDSVEEFLGDIEGSLDRYESDYFVGLVVIQATPVGEWILLDGQQRLTTISLVYAAIRRWFFARGFDDDARQIDHEFLGVRRLGGEYSSRMLLNSENQVAFQEAISQETQDFRLKALAKDAPRTSSNRLLLSAAVNCRDWVESFANNPALGGDEERQSERVYALARFLDTRLKVVAVEVSDEVDAYVLFESLNDRGVALSALDLIKNYIFSRTPENVEVWDQLLNELADQNPDDFLKVFWTSRRGLISKSQIFKGVKSLYETRDGVRILLAELLQDARILAALTEDDSPFWEGYTPEIRDLIYIIRSLDSKQARPVLIAILRELKDEQLVLQCVWSVAVAIVRFQVIGKGRTGVVEKVFGRLCEQLSRGDIASSDDFNESISELHTDDATFRDAFVRHRDKKFSRIATLLACDAALDGAGTASRVSIRDARIYLDNFRPASPILTSDSSDEVAAAGLRVASYWLVKSNEDVTVPAPDLGVSLANHDLDAFVAERSIRLADRATKVWAAGAAR